MFVKGYSDFSLSQAGVKTHFETGASFGAHFRLKNNVGLLFPYINATVQNSRYHNNPEYIQFVLDDIHITLYPNDVVAAPFKDQTHALKFVEHLIGFLEDLYAKKDSIRPDHKRYKPVPAFDIFKLLPQTNCKACGFLTCMAFAGALSQRETTPDKCPEFTKPIAENRVYPVFDKNGNLASTVELEIYPKEKDFQQKPREDHLDPLEQNGAEMNQETKPAPEKYGLDIQTDLTGREMEVLRLVSEGATNTQISDILSISPHTVKSHVIHIFNKLGVNDRTQAAVWAARHNLV